ncbi:hypothetical protein [Sorangium cellulosum]|uniref:Uncharacterized protein n=1 Tax=Sorangium cellulosum So0157-2 TaxID=1254432 RepID=S4XWH4_SORCE|nr:hypothetical protein [Sorangium cellulosum]AGP36255.1 hypothetical protein SCE1572_18215 [Sorangium cellulosum So0157-2]
MRWPRGKFWGYTALVLAVSAILHWKWSQGQIESARQKLMARQRAVAVELGPRWLPMRERVEGWTLDLARSAGAELVDREALKAWNFRELAGIYLRLRVDEAESVDAVRKNAQQSLRDAFTACLLRVPNPNPLAGAECKRTRDCPAGEYCNEAERCSRPAQPFNLRVAYRTMHVLSDEWVRDAQDASSELRLRLLESSFEDTMRDDVPLAAELLTRAQYYLVVLDEPAEGATSTEALLGVPHMARVGVWRLSDGKPILRVRREASGHLIGGTPSVEGSVLEARQRQANSCALALAVREAMGDTTAAAAEPQ